MQVTTGKRYVSDGAATGKGQMAAGNIRYLQIKKAVLSGTANGILQAIWS